MPPNECWLTRWASQPCSQLSSVTSSFSHLPPAPARQHCEMRWDGQCRQSSFSTRCRCFPLELGQQSTSRSSSLRLCLPWQARPGRNKPGGAAEALERGQGEMEVRQGQGPGTPFIRSAGTLRKTTCDCRHIRLLQIWNRSNNLRAKYRLRIIVLY